MLAKQRSGWVGTAPGRRVPKAVVMLLSLGVDTRVPAPYNPRRVLTLWKRTPWEIQEVLNDAAKVYRAKAALTHPDAGGSVEAMQSLNVLWDQIRSVFAKRGFTPE